MTGFILVSTTVGSECEARHIARGLVETRLAACVQISAIKSVYRWEDDIVEANEHLLICKVAAADFQVVEAAIRARHSYDLPEIVATEITAAYAPYAAWMREATNRGDLASINSDAKAAAPGDAAA